MYLEFNEREEFYSWAELRHLAMALGFPKDVFEKNLPSYHVKDQDGIAIKDLIKCCDDRCFYLDLHFTVNMKSAVYNTNVFKKSLLLVSSRFLSFKQLQDVRLAFESYENYDNKGMLIDERIFLRTLKMCGRVISPRKLMHKLKHLKDSYKEKGRIQLFEFLDLLALCELVDDQVIHNETSSPVEKTWTKLYQVDSFKQLVIPNDKKMWKMLNQRYQEELKCRRPEMKSWRFTANPLAADDFRMQVRLSNQQFETLQRNLKNSSKQIKLAKGGFTDFVRPSTALANKSIKSKQTGSVYPDTKSRAMSAPPPLPPYVSTTDEQRELRKLKRPKSSPPVISDATIQDFANRVENVEFDINTEEQRWREHYQENISRILPNYHDVLQRMRKPHLTPQSRKNKIYRRQRPSSAFISRLSDPTPRLPNQHLEHCDALTLGIGSDEHSKALRNKATRVRCKSAPAQRLNRKSSPRLSPRRTKHRYSSLLESLMREYGYVSDDEEEKSERSERSQTHLLETEDEKYSEIVDAETAEKHEHVEDSLNEDKVEIAVESSNSNERMKEVAKDAEQSTKFQYFKSQEEKKSAILELMKNSCFHRTFICQ